MAGLSLPLLWATGRSLPGEQIGTLTVRFRCPSLRCTVRCSNLHFRVGILGKSCQDGRLEAIELHPGGRLIDAEAAGDGLEVWLLCFNMSVRSMN